MRKQTTEPRPSVVKLDTARRSIRAKSRTGLDKLRLGAHATGDAEPGGTVSQVFERAVRGIEKRN